MKNLVIQKLESKRHVIWNSWQDGLPPIIGFGLFI